MYDRTKYLVSFEGNSISFFAQKGLVTLNIPIVYQLKETVRRVQIKNNKQIENPVNFYYRQKNRSYFSC